MEGLIPFVLNALKKKRLHQHSYRTLSDSSRQNYRRLLTGGDSVNGSSHRRTRSEFQAPSSMDFGGMLIRSQSFIKDPNKVSGSNPDNRANQTRSHVNHPSYDQHHQKWL